MPYFAEIDENSIVKRVIVADNIEWPQSRLGGTWVETADPYSTEPQAVPYCGPGWGYDSNFPVKFAPPWIQPAGADVDGFEPYSVGKIVFHNGFLWTSTVENNVWEPGVSGWRRVPGQDGLPPPWIQPTGALDAYTIGEQVMHNGDRWEGTEGDGGGTNSWEPGVFGWTNLSVPSGPLAWVQPTGADNSYAAGAQVTHNGQTWESTVDANVWEPGVFGWTVVE